MITDFNYTAVKSEQLHRFRAENERLREALERIAVFYRGGERATESLLEMRAIARRALKSTCQPSDAADGQH